MSLRKLYTKVITTFLTTCETCVLCVAVLKSRKLVINFKLQYFQGLMEIREKSVLISHNPEVVGSNPLLRS